MYRIIKGRGTGKTHELMELAKATGAAIACSNPKGMEQTALAYGITGLNFISYSKLFDGSVDSHDNILIDEVECLIHNYIDGKIIGYTLTNED